MFNHIIMCGILAFLFFMLAFRAEYVPDGNNGFFNLKNTKAMRGFWCLIVIFVHVPQAHQNTIQDMIGSFAYIGVTFFFMTSAYGLSASISKKPNIVKTFWRNRLPKLLIPNWTVNIVVSSLFFFIWKNSIRLDSLFNITDWVRWLLACYIAFWISFSLVHSKKFRTVIVCILIFILSMSVYYLRMTGIIESVTWCSEVFGFIWGILMFTYYHKIKDYLLLKWPAKVCATCFLSLSLGVSYLLLKHVVFWGDYVLKIMLGLSILCFILTLNRKIQIGNAISCFLGEISFEIYLIHNAVFTIIERAFPNIGSGVFILSSIFLSVLLAAVIHNICNVLLNRLYFYQRRLVS